MGGGRGDSAPAFWHPQSEALPIPFLYPFKAKGSLGCSAFSADAGPELLRLNSSRKKLQKKTQSPPENWFKITSVSQKQS